MKYRDHVIDYPELDDEILPFGVSWNYISSTFLNGIVNYYEPVSAWVLDRYYGDEESLKYYPKTDSYCGEKFKINSKQHAIELSYSDNFIHTKFDIFEDDGLW